MKKLRLLLAFCALLLGWSNASADTDKTSSVSTTWKNSTGSGNAGTAASSAAPYVTPSGGSSVAMNEAYNDSNTGDTGILLQQTISGLENGTYKVEFYANAIHANNVTQSATSYTNARVYVFANTQYKQVTPEEKNTTTQNGEYTINNVVVSDGTLKLGLYKHSAGTNWHTIQIKRLTLLSDAKATNTTALMNASATSPIDATDFLPVSVITNSTATGWTFTGSGRGYSNGVWEVYNQNFKLQQTLSNIPNGRYIVKVQGFYRAGGGGTTSTAQNVKLFANGVNSNALNILSESYDSQPGTGKWSEVSTKFVPNDRAAGGYAFYRDEKYKNNSVTTYVTNNTLNLGLEKTVAVGSDWSLFNGFEIQCTGIYLSALAVNFTSGNTMEAGQWYKYTIPTDGDYSFSAIDGIVYSTTDAIASDTHSNVSSTTALPAGTVYIKSNTSQTLTITYVDPVVANGDYYLYDATNKVFLSRGNHYGTQASIDPYGIPFTYNNYEKSLRFKDWSSAGLFYNGSEYFTDGGTPGKFIFETTEGGFYFKDQNNSKYLKNAEGSETSFGNNSLVQATSVSDATVWTLKTKAEHDAIVATYSTDNKTSVIASAGISTTAEDFESYLATNLAAKDKTSSVGTYNFDNNENGNWTWTKVEDRNSGAINYADKVAEAYLNTGFWTQTVEGLQPGIYKVGVNAFERETSYEACNTLGADGYEIVTAYFEANGERVQLKSWYSDKTDTNNPDSRSQSYTAFFNDKYKNEVYAYVADGGNGTGTLTLKVAKPAYAGSSWVLFNNITLTYYDANVSPEEATAIINEANTTMGSPMKHSLYAALSTAKSTFEGAQTVPNYNALRAAIDNTATSIASYANMNTNYLAPLNTYFATTNFVQSDAYKTYLGYKNSYDNYTTTGADVENATANALSITQGSGTNYTSTYSLMMLPNWTIGTTPASTTNSGFYMNTWSTENKGTGDAKDFENPFFEYWVSSGSLATNTITGTLTGLTPNKAYDVTAKVRVLGASKVAGSITMEVVGGVPVDVTAGDAIMDGENPTGRYIKSYTATGVTDADGNLELKFNIAANSNISWLSFRDVNYEESEAVISNDFTAINTAISEAEAHTLGFEEGDYAPYTNIAGLNAIATAKAFDKSRYYIPAVITAAASALSSVSWTANAVELNAVYNGDFSLSTNDDAPAGWILTDASNTTMGGQYRPRAFVLTSGDGNYAKLASFGQGDGTRSAFYFRFDDRTAQNAVYTYGGTEGYTMPLKENTVYKLTAQIGGWGQTRDIKMAIVNSSDEDVVAQTNTLENVDVSGSVTGYEMYFVVPASGNYKLRLTNATSGQNNAAVISNIVLKSADALEFADDAAVPTYAPGTYPSVKITRNLTANRWATAVYPFAINKSAVGEIAVLARYNSEAEIIGFDNADNSTANKPFLMRSTTDKSVITLKNVEVVAASATDSEAGDASLVGSYVNNTVVEKDAGNYILSNNTIYPVGDDVTVNAYRAYINIAGSTPARALRFVVGEITGVDNVEAATNATLKDGKYLENGKIVIVKNGQKFNANGQQVK